MTNFVTAPNMNRSRFTRQIARDLVGRILTVFNEEDFYEFTVDNGGESSSWEKLLVIGYEPKDDRSWELKVVNLADRAARVELFDTPRRIVKIGRRLFTPTN